MAITQSGTSAASPNDLKPFAFRRGSPRKRTLKPLFFFVPILEDLAYLHPQPWKASFDTMY